MMALWVREFKCSQGMFVFCKKSGNFMAEIGDFFKSSEQNDACLLSSIFSKAMAVLKSSLYI